MERIKQLHRKSDFECLFWYDDSSHPLRLLLTQNANYIKRDIVKKHVNMLKETQEREKEFFWQEAAASNLLAFLYLTTRKQDLALEQLKLSLERYPNNLNATVGMIRILEQKFLDSETETHIDRYRTLTKVSKEMEKQINICQGEIAYACSFIGPDFYTQAVDRYEALLHPTSKVWLMEDELKGYVVRWKYYLAYTYNRMLNKGHTEKLAEKLGTSDICAIFSKISELYMAVIGSNDVFCRGKSMIDLVDTHKKCETSGSYRKIEFPYGSADNFVKRALNTAPSDPHVLERCGRHYRQRATKRKDFEKAVTILDSLLDIHPTRHVAWHHKGLAYRALWHIVGKYDEAKLYTNSARKGNKKRVRKQKAALVHSEIVLTDSPTVQFQSESVDFEFQSFSDGEWFRSMLLNEGTTDQLEMLSVWPEVLRTAPTELPTLLPWISQALGDVPKQLKKPDFFDKLRTSNPPVKNGGGSRRCLEQARNCFEVAKTITRGTCSRYIVDLARSLISLGSYDSAEKHFQSANSLASMTNSNDAAYLYEQWALLRHSRAIQVRTREVARREMKSVARLYRQAILSAVRARERSRVAFYELRDLLREELRHDPDNPALKMEYDVLYNSVQNYSECNEMLVEAMKKDEDTRSIAWHLIRLLRDRHHEHDAATAFVYLTALHEAGQLNLEESEAIPDAPHQESHRQLLINVVWELVCDWDQTNANGGQTFGEIFRWMVGSRRISESGYVRLDRDSPRPFADSGEICILAPRDTTPGVDTVLRVLQDVCGIVVVRAFWDGDCDIPYGSSTSEGLRAVVAISQAVVVVEHSTDADNWNQLFPVMEELMKIKEVKMCLVADEMSDCSNTEQRYVERWPRLIIQRHCNDIDLAYTLFKTLFP